MRWRVLLIAEHDEQAALITRTLVAAEHDVVAHIQPQGDVTAFAMQARPDVVVAEVDVPSKELLKHIEHVIERLSAPVVVFTRRSDNAVMCEAVKAGVSGYVVDGLSSERLVPVIETAMERFRIHHMLRVERDQALARLSERVVIERAKGILMRRRQVPESEAYHALRRMAMDRGQRVGIVAETIVSAEEMLAKS